MPLVLLFLLVVLVVVDFFFLLLVVVVVLAVVAEDELPPGLELPLPPDPLTIARKTTSTATSASGARNRAGVLLVPWSIAHGMVGRERS